MSDVTLSRVWFSAAELAALKLPAMAGAERSIQRMAAQRDWLRPEWEGRTWRPRKGQGGGVELHYSVLPHEAQTVLALRYPAGAAVPDVAGPGEAARGELARAEMWARFARTMERCEPVRAGTAVCTAAACTQRCQGTARGRLAVLQAVEALTRGGMARVPAILLVAKEHGLAKSTVYRGFDVVASVDRVDRMAALLPHHVGTGTRAELPAEAWELLKADWLAPEKAPFEECWRRLQKVATARGWALPSPRTAQRRLAALPVTMRVLAREGGEALRRMYPAQERDYSVLHALEAVDTDGHLCDVFVRWPDGSVARPQVVPFQDLYSGKILSFRVDQTLHGALVRLAFGDMVERWGIPSACYMDNGREFANKLMTGGIPNRFRFKVRAEDPDGVMKIMGVEVHWCTPYSGQSKRIERGFGEFAHNLATHPAFAGAYVGHKPDAKPENYGSKAVPLDVFERVLGEWIAEWNARTGRRNKVAQGRSFDAVFAESYERSAALIRRPTEDQRRLWLMAAEGVRANAIDGSVRVLGNRFWAGFLLEHRKQKLMVRFDPDAVQDDLHVYRLDGTYLGAAVCKEAVGFNDVAAATRDNRARAQFRRGERMKLDAERTLSRGDVAAAVAAATPAAEPAPAPEQKVVRAVFGNTALKPRPETAAQIDIDQAHSRAVRKLRLVREDTA